MGLPKKAASSDSFFPVMKTSLYRGGMELEVWSARRHMCRVGPSAKAITDPLCGTPEERILVVSEEVLRVVGPLINKN